MHIGLDHDGVEGLIDPTATLQDRGEEAALPDLRDLEGEIPGLRGDLPGSGSIPPGRPRQAPLMRLGADVVGGLLIDQGLVEEGHHLAHQIEIGALVDSIRERGQVKIKVGHRSFFLSRLTRDTLRMLRWPAYFADPPNATTSGDVNVNNVPEKIGEHVRRDSMEEAHVLFLGRCLRNGGKSACKPLAVCFGTALSVVSLSMDLRDECQCPVR